MEEIKSLGSVALFRINGNAYTLTEETGELFVGTILGKVIFKMKWKDMEFALPIIENKEWIQVHVNGESKYFKSEVLKYFMILFTDNG